MLANNFIETYEFQNWINLCFRKFFISVIFKKKSGREKRYGKCCFLIFLKERIEEKPEWLLKNVIAGIIGRRIAFFKWAYIIGINELDTC